MKRVLIFALVLMLALSLGGCADKQDKPSKSTPPTRQEVSPVYLADYGPHRPVGVYAVEDSMKDADYHAQTTPTADLDNEFYQARQDFFNYFYNLWGFDVSFDLIDTEGFDDTELLHSVCFLLSREIEGDAGATFTKTQLNAAAKRYYGQTIDNFNGCSECVYSSKSQTLTWSMSCGTTPGNFMVLRQLRVQEDGVCVAIFDRSHEKYYTGELPTGADGGEAGKAVLDGAYDDLSKVDTIIMTFREAKQEDRGDYLQILSITPYTGAGSHTK